MQKASPPVIETVHDALVLIPTRREVDPDTPSGYRFDGGVYDSDRRVVTLAQQLGGGGSNVPLDDVGDVVPEHEAGTWLFGGWIRNHFGHFIEENLTRLWALRECDAPVDGIVFLLWGGWDGHSERRANATAKTWFVREAFALLGITCPIRVLIAPTRFETLIVPQQLLLRSHAPSRSGWKTQRAFLRSMLDRAPRRPRLSPPRIYVSRAGLGIDKARFLFEEQIEENLRQSGYTIVRPETLTLGEQAAVYASARKIIFAEGSAIHFAAPFCGPRTSAVILTRRWFLQSRFGSQLQLMGCTVVHVLDERLGSIVAAGGGDPVTTARAQFAPHVLPDFERLWEQLRAFGFVNARKWQAPSPEAIRAEIAATISAKDERFAGVAHTYVEETASNSATFESLEGKLPAETITSE